MNKNILDLLYDVFREYVGHMEPNENSQLSMMWSPNDPPDVLEGTPQLDAIEEVFNISLTENNGVELFDMTLLEASVYIQKVMVSG